ncbi:MAG: class I SAM-dependent methyltransferase [Gemmobacter sp.]|nr:class I SAM-dependent methyltransferase [Gemmobacter sp.]
MRDSSARYAQHYNHIIFDPAMRALYEGSNFFNVGYWRDISPVIQENLNAACTALVQAHIDLDPDAGRATGQILDIGCGLGDTTRMFADAYPQARLTGVNFSAEQVAFAAERQPDLTFIQKDAARLDLPSDSAERIFCVEAAFHFNTRLDFLREGFRVLKPGGRLIFSDVLYTRSIYGIPKENTGMSVETFLDQIRAIGWDIEIAQDITPETGAPYLQLLCDAGFERAGRIWMKLLQHYLLISLRKP